MYFWKAHCLAAELKDGRVSQRTQLRYFLAALVIQCLVGRSSILRSLTSPVAAVVPLVTLVISVAGLIRCFRINSRGDNRDFVPRMLCLGLPTLLRTYALYALIAAVVLAVTGVRPPWQPPTTWMQWGVWSGLYLFVLLAYFIQLGRYIELAAGTPVAAPAA